MNTISLIPIINFVIAVLFLLCYAHQILYVFASLFHRKKRREENQGELSPAPFHRYAILIAARNEEAVIGNLLDSIRRQDYPAEMLTVFVVADNCTDQTASIARQWGAVVYERFNTVEVGKGYALDFLTRRIAEDYGSFDAFDGYFVFDADNLLEEGYLAAMNRTFSDGYSIVTSYRNAKNFGDNWISAGHALWFLRETAFLNRPRMLLHTSCAVSGCGFLFDGQLLSRYGGWRFHLLTEDIEFTMRSVMDGERIGYCEDAVFYDEQPVRFSQSWRQRLRWSKGYLQVFLRYGKELFSKIGTIGRKNGFACFDMISATIPAIVLSIASVLANGTSCICRLFTEGMGSDTIASLMRLLLCSIAGSCGMMFLLGALVMVTQSRAIDMPVWKKVWYTLTFPVFMLTYIPIAVCCVFQKVTWKPIEHTADLSIADLQRKHGSLRGKHSVLKIKPLE